MSAEHPPTELHAGRYVVLRHRWPMGQANALSGGSGAVDRGDHYDWMFEVQGCLLSWASEPFLPPQQAAAIAATRLPPHRLFYLDYEGPVSGDRGTVHRVEAGSHRLLRRTINQCEFELSGGRCGRLRIYRTASSEVWRIAFVPYRDEPPTGAEAS